MHNFYFRGLVDFARSFVGAVDVLSVASFVLELAGGSRIFLYSACLTENGLRLDALQRACGCGSCVGFLDRKCLAFCNACTYYLGHFKNDGYGAVVGYYNCHFECLSFCGLQIHVKPITRDMAICVAVAIRRGILDHVAPLITKAAQGTPRTLGA